MKNDLNSVWEASKKYAGKEPGIATTKGLELTDREIWEGDRAAFIAGANWALEKSADIVFREINSYTPAASIVFIKSMIYK